MVGGEAESVGERARTAAIFGREQQLERLVRLLEPGTSQVVTLTGRSGSGKTRLALELIATRPLGEHQVWWVDLAGADVGDEATLPARHRGTPPSAPTRIAPADLDDAVAAGDLVVLDNAVLVDPGWVASIVDRCPGAQVLVTRHVPLGLAGERVVRVDPLPTPSVAASDDEVRQSPAVQMYLARAAERGLAGAGEPFDASTIAELCRRLDGLPLAIEMAAARSDVLPAADLLGRLDADPSLAVLAMDRWGSPARHRDLASSVRWSIDVHVPEARRLLGRLALAQGALEFHEVTRLADAGVDVATRMLADLVDHGLVVRASHRSSALYTVPATVGAVARAGLGADRPDAADRVVEVARPLADRLLADVLAGREERVIDALRARGPLLTAASTLALEVGDAPGAVDALAPMTTWWRLRGSTAEAVELADHVVAAGRSAGLLTPSMAVLMAGTAAARSERNQVAGDAEDISLLAGAVEVASRCGDVQALLVTLMSQVVTVPYTRDLATASSAIDEGLAIAERHGLTRWVGRFQAWAGMLANAFGRLDDAARASRAAASCARLAGDLVGSVIVTVLLGPLLTTFPELQDDVGTLDEGAEVARQHGLLRYEAILTVHAVLVAVQSGDLGAARRCSAQSLRVARLLGHPYDIIALLVAANGAAALGDGETAVRAVASVEHHVGELAPFTPAPFMSMHLEMVRRLQGELTPKRYHAAVRAGQRLSRRQAIDEVQRSIDGWRPIARSSESVPAEATALAALTARQIDMLRLVAEGKSNKDIAGVLHVAPKTVTHHLSAVYQALGVRTRTQAARRWMEIAASTSS